MVKEKDPEAETSLEAETFHEAEIDIDPIQGEEVTDTVMENDPQEKEQEENQTGKLQMISLGEMEETGLILEVTEEIKADLEETPGEGMKGPAVGLKKEEMEDPVADMKKEEAEMLTLPQEMR